MNRQDANRLIIELLSNAVETYPDLRFGQVMQALLAVKPQRPAHPDQEIPWQNEFYMESTDLLKRIKTKSMI